MPTNYPYNVIVKLVTLHDAPLWYTGTAEDHNPVDGNVMKIWAGHHLEGRELMEVSGKERGAADDLHQVLRDGPGEAKPVVGGRPPAKLIDDDQRLAARSLQHPQPTIASRSA